MKANRLADMKAVRGKHFDPNDPDGEDQEILGILPTHPMVTAVSGATDSAKLLRHLEKAEAKGRLDTLYERRLLDYMRRGHTVVDKTEQKKQDFERQYRRCVRKVNAIFALAALVVGMALVFGLRALLFRGTRLVEYTLPIGALEISVGTAKCILFGLISAIGIFSTGKVLLGTPLMKRFYPKDEKSRAYYARENESARTGKQVAEAVVGMLLMVLLSVYAATNNFGIGGGICALFPGRLPLPGGAGGEPGTCGFTESRGRRTRTAHSPRWRTATPFRTARIIPTMWASWCPAARRRKSCWLLRRKTARPYRRSRPKRILKNENFRN